MSLAEHPGNFLRFLLFEEEMLVHAAAERTTGDVTTVDGGNIAAILR